jgi:hypothetical protein
MCRGMKKVQPQEDIAFCPATNKRLTFAMAPEQKKRARPAPAASQRSKKRQKIVPTEKTSAPVSKRPVAVDALPWNEVKMPDMFDDAEGFFGLEEVEGVEVIKEGGTLKFVCTKERNAELDLIKYRLLQQHKQWMTKRSLKALTTMT